MNTKKIILGFCTVLAFFLGQILLESALSAAGAPEKTFAEFLVPVLSLAAGWVIGFFYKKVSDEDIIAGYSELISTYKQELDNASEKKPRTRRTNKVS